MEVKMEAKKRVNITKVILTILATGGLMTMAVLAPNALQSLELLTGRRKYNRRYYLKTTASRLANKGLIRWEKGNNKTFAGITDKGRQTLARYQLGDYDFQKPKRWDGKWRLLIFDIKESKREVRNQFRLELSNFGFRRLQNSVWVTPHECGELSFLLKTALGLGREVIYISESKIENDKELRKIFSLIKD